jgi:protein phosphatase
MTTLATFRQQGTLIRAYGLTDVGCKRTNNEDAFLISSEMGLYAVADGMGGANAGEVASRLAIETLSSYFRREAGRSQEALEHAFLAAHEKIQAHSSKVSGCRGMGTTMVAVLSGEEGVSVASVGDSRVYLYQGGQLIQLTEDQTWINEVGRKLKIDEETLRRHPYRHILTQALGVSERLKVQLVHAPTPPGCQVVLSSDGLHGVVEPEIIKQVLTSGRKLSERCHSLVEAAKRAGGPDNITVVLLEL